MTVTLSNVLGDLAERIRLANDAATAANLTAIEKTIESGRLLLRAKDACKHGEWLPFLERAGVEERTAQRHMKLAKSELKSDMVSDLGGVVAALEYLAEPALPPAGQTLFLANKRAGLGYYGWVWETERWPGYYHYRVARVTPDGGELVHSKRAMSAKRMDVDGKSVNIFWRCLCDSMNVSSISLLEVIGTMQCPGGGSTGDQTWEDEADAAHYRDIAEAHVWAKREAEKSNGVE
jgi:hypothetical protein